MKVAWLVGYATTYFRVYESVLGDNHVVRGLLAFPS
jgi:hypothetical protein